MRVKGRNFLSLVKEVVRSQLTLETPRQPQCLSQVFATRDFSKKSNKQELVNENKNLTFELEEYQRLMEKSIDHFQNELANIRMGRATPGMLDHLKVEAYGEKLPMKAVGTVSVKSPQLLSVTVFDNTLVDSVLSTISSSPLELNPKADGQEILVPVPSPTHETLEAMKKLCKSEAEAAKVSIRHTRKLAMSNCAKSFSCKDERYTMEKVIQRLTDSFTDKIDDQVRRKNDDIEAGKS